MWAPKGERPVALGHHRFEWLHVAAFVQPTSGETVWYLCSGLNTPFFAALLTEFARAVGERSSAGDTVLRVKWVMGRPGRR